MDAADLESLLDQAMAQCSKVLKDEELAVRKKGAKRKKCGNQGFDQAFKTYLVQEGEQGNEAPVEMRLT